MSEPTSAYTLADLQAEVAEAMGIAYYGAAGDEAAQAPVDVQDLNSVTRIINKGIRMFLMDAPPAGWNWLHPLASVSLWPSVAVDADVTATGVYDAGTALTTITASEAVFYPEMELHDIVVTDTGTYEIVTYTSTTVVIISGDHEFVDETFSIAADGHYTLPQTFAGRYSGEIDFAAGSGHASGIAWTHESEIRRRRKISDTTTGPPRLATIQKTNTSRRWELLVFPTPGSLETVEFVYDIHFDSLAVATDLHPAGVQYDDAVLAACLARAEMDNAELLTGRVEYYRRIALPSAWQNDSRSHPRKVSSFGRPSHGVPAYKYADWEVKYPSD